MAESIIASSLIKVGAYAIKQATTHCKHCKGHGPCECSFGCPVRSTHRCFAFFKDRTCASCRSVGIRGSLFQCRSCKNLNLCSTCYHREVHPDHDFIEFQRMGTEPIFHDAQSKPKVAKITYMPSQAATSPHPSPQSVQQPMVAKITHLPAPLTCPPAMVVQAAPAPVVPAAPPIHPTPYQRYSVPNLQQHQRPTVTVSAQPLNQSMPNVHGKRIACDLCHREGSRASHYKCATCADFDLCETCHSTGYHGHHGFYQFKDGAEHRPILHPASSGSAAVVHFRVGCHQCGAQDIKGSRYKCAICTNLDLCQKCYGKGFHGHHAFVRYDKLNDKSPVYLSAKDGTQKNNSESLPVHSRVMCDECQRRDIVGNRFECSVCESFDLCQSCHSNGAHGHHAFFKHTRPGATRSLVPAYCTHTASSSSSSSSPSSSPSPVHKRVTCDCCRAKNIHGARYQCEHCENYNLCERCYNKQTHGHHDFLRYDRPGALPLFLTAQCPPTAPPQNALFDNQGNSEENETFLDQFANELMDNGVEDLAEQFGDVLGNVFGGDPADESEDFGFDC